MTTLPPPSAHFRFAYGVPHGEPSTSSSTGEPFLQPETPAAIVPLKQLDGSGHPLELEVCWNLAGLSLCVPIPLATAQPAAAGRAANSRKFAWTLRLWIDTRCTQSVHRATKYCHLFSIKESPEVDTKGQMLVELLKIEQSRETPPLKGIDGIRAKWIPNPEAADRKLALWIPADCMYGFAPADSPQLGFHAALSLDDGELRLLALNQEFPAGSDPSLWQVLNLQRASATPARGAKRAAVGARRKRPAPR